MSITLWPEQQPAHEFARSRDNVALFCEQRTGKTYITLKDVEVYGKEICGVLVTLLNNKETTWLSNLSSLLPHVHVTTDLDAFKKLPNPRLLVVHWEHLPKIINNLVRYKKINWCCADESHRAQHRGTGFARALARLYWVERKILLTGTPMEKDIRSLFQQFKFLDRSIFGTNWNDFCEQWFEWPKLDMSEYPHGTPQWKARMLEQKILKNNMTLKEGSAEAIAKIIEPYCFRLTKLDVGIKEPKVSVKRVKLTTREQIAYQSMKRKGFIKLGDGTTVMADMPVTKVAKRRQLAGGWVFDEDRNVREFGNSKLQAVRKWLKKRTPPVVIFTAFVPELLELARMSVELGYVTETLYGKTPKPKRPDIIRGFLGGEVEVLICQGRTGGTGVDLYSADYAAVMSLDYSSITWDQLKSRLDHKGRKKAAKFKVFCSENTIDEDLYDLVIKKGLTGRDVLDRLHNKPKRKSKMAKVKDKAKAKEKEKPAKKEAPKAKYGMAEAMEYTGMTDKELRAAFRKDGVEKWGEEKTRYGWDSKGEMTTVLDPIKAAKNKPKKSKKKKKDENDDE